MKRQVIAFISLFSLVLVLSVYYVMLPFTTDPLDEVVNVNVTSSNDLYYSSLEVAKTDAYDEYIASLYDIIASSESSNEEKALAFEEISNINKQLELENKVKEELKEIGFENVYVEFNEDTVTIIISAEEPSKLEAAKAISVAYNVFGTDKYVEVIFKN